MDFKTDGEKIAAAMESALKKAEELKLKRVAFPAFGTGIGNFPPEKSADIMIQTIVNHLRRGSSLEQVIFAIIDEHIYAVFRQKLKDVVFPNLSLHL
jgi:O-acetyl-ADP-ribose deacetylase (regulator of RNase III)